MVVTNFYINHNALFQYIVYDSDSFIADVGGYLGLLLGQSVYGLYEIITQWLKSKGSI